MPTEFRIRLDVNIWIGFAVHALTIDGLRVSPFDRHVEGTGSLREGGLSAEQWRSWLSDIAAAQLQFASSGGRGCIVLPAEYFGGAGSLLRDRVEKLWESYVPLAHAWRRLAVADSEQIASSLARCTAGGTTVFQVMYVATAFLQLHRDVFVLALEPGSTPKEAELAELIGKATSWSTD